MEHTEKASKPLAYIFNTEDTEKRFLVLTLRSLCALCYFPSVFSVYSVVNFLLKTLRLRGSA